MSRSRRKNPVWGWCGASSEKGDKRIWHRRYRTTCRRLLHIHGEDLELLPHFRELSCSWDFAKDGKGWYGYPRDCKCTLELTCTCEWWRRRFEKEMRK